MNRSAVATAHNPPNHKLIHISKRSTKFIKTQIIFIICNENEWLASRPGRFVVAKRAPLSIIRSSMDPRADIDMVANFKIVNSRLESTLRTLRLSNQEKLLLTELNGSRINVATLLEPYTTKLTSFNPTVHVVLSFSFVFFFIFAVSFSCFLTVYHSPYMFLFHPSLIFLLSSSTISFAYFIS